MIKHIINSKRFILYDSDNQKYISKHLIQLKGGDE